MISLNCSRPIIIDYFIVELCVCDKLHFFGMRFGENLPNIVKIVDPEFQAI